MVRLFRGGRHKNLSGGTVVVSALGVTYLYRGFCEIDNSRGQVGRRRLLRAEVVALGVDKTRDDEAAEIERQAVGEAHDRHVARRAARRAEKTDRLVFPGTAGELNEVLGGGVAVVIVNGHGDDDDARGLDPG